MGCRGCNGIQNSGYGAAATWEDCHGTASQGSCSTAGQSCGVPCNDNAYQMAYPHVHMCHQDCTKQTGLNWACGGCGCTINIWSPCTSSSVDSAIWDCGPDPGNFSWRDCSGNLQPAYPLYFDLNKKTFGAFQDPGLGRIIVAGT
jgi:hypothetical protein